MQSCISAAAGIGSVTLRIPRAPIKISRRVDGGGTAEASRKPSRGVGRRDTVQMCSAALSSPSRAAHRPAIPTLPVRPFVPHSGALRFACRPVHWHAPQSFPLRVGRRLAPGGGAVVYIVLSCRQWCSAPGPVQLQLQLQLQLPRAIFVPVAPSLGSGHCASNAGAAGRWSVSRSAPAGCAAVGGIAGQCVATPFRNGCQCWCCQSSPQRRWSEKQRAHWPGPDPAVLKPQGRGGKLSFDNGRAPAVV